MSYILDALKKAEREREVGTVPSFGSVHDGTRPVNRTTWSSWALPIGVAVASVIAAVSWMQHRTPAQAPAVAPAPQPAAASTRTATANRLAQPARPGAMVQPPVSRPMRADSKPASPVVVRKEPLQRLDALVIAPRRPAPQAPTATRPEPVATVPAMPVVAPPTAQPAVAAIRPDLDELPLLYEMGPAFQSSVPPFRMDVHVYSDTHSRSFLIMNGRKYREGDDLGRGAVLVAITAEGAVVDYSNERFRVLY